VASVSGWKAQVRKAAKNVGKEHIASLNPSSGSSTALQPKPDVTDRKPQQITLERPAIKDASDRRVLFGLPRRRFSVLGGKNFVLLAIG
jgi:hypothetical protein